jgi:hypothetical protein
MTISFNPPVNVAHIAGPDGRCVRCGAGLGANMILNDDDGTIGETAWVPGERVVEYECSDGRTRFADSVAGRTVDCVA